MLGNFFGELHEGEVSSFIEYNDRTPSLVITLNQKGFASVMVSMYYYSQAANHGLNVSLISRRSDNSVRTFCNI